MAILSCSIAECERKSVCRGWCDMHYRRWKSHGDPLIVKPGNGQKQRGVTTEPAPIENQCAIEECTSAKKIRGWCVKHYKRSWRGYDPALGGARNDSAPCAVDGCSETIRTGGYCYSHYARLKLHGNATAGMAARVPAIDHANGNRTCNTCGIEKAITEFYPAKYGRRGRKTQCSACETEYFRTAYAENKAHFNDLSKAIRHQRRAHLKGQKFESGLTRAKIRKRDGDNCAYCGTLMDFEVIGRVFVGNKATIDHILPISKGGSHTMDNVTLACLACNCSKGAKTMEEWTAIRAIAG